MNKRISVGVTAAIVIIAVTITFTATMIFSTKLYDRKVLAVKESAQMYNTIYELDTLVRENYYKELENKQVYASTLVGFLAGLNDPYSKYLTSTQIETLTKLESGTGISYGVEVAQRADGYMIIKNVVSGSRASDEGLLKNDLVTAVGGENVLEIGYDAAYAKFDDLVEGKELTINVNRDGRDIAARIECETLELPTIESYLYENIGYIRVVTFNSLTEVQFDRTLNAYIESGITGLIIDLRDNAGGMYVEDAAAALDSLCGSGTLVSATYADNQTKVLCTSDSDKINIPFVVLVNENTEYVAEIFAASLRDMTGCDLIGVTTKGHGTMQKILRLTTGNGMILTVATLNPPISQSYDGEGLEPDYFVEASEGFKLGDTVPSETNDAQFKKALDVLGTLMHN